MCCYFGQIQQKDRQGLYVSAYAWPGTSNLPQLNRINEIEHLAHNLFRNLHVTTVNNKISSHIHEERNVSAYHLHQGENSFTSINGNVPLPEKNKRE
jgi:hypothetical protein